MKIKVDLSLRDTKNSQILIDGEHYCASMSLIAIFIVAHITAHIVIVRAAMATLKGLMVAPLYATQTADIKAQREVVDRQITKLGSIVENIANDPAIANDARVGIVESAGMDVKGYTKRQRDHFEVSNGDISGVVMLRAQGGANAHEWFYTLDLVNHTDHIHLDGTVAANTSKDGFVKGREYAFFHRPIDKTSPNPWEGPENLVIL